MKRNKLVSIAAITVALGVLATGCAGGSGSSKSDSKSSGGTKTVTVKAGTGANVKPYTYVGDDNETTGYDVEVLKEVFDRLDGYDLQIEVTDIPSVFSGVTSGTSLESVPKGQIEAANALGMTYFQALRRVILPEAIVVALPSLGNSFIGLIKGTSLAFVCAVVEMTAAGKIIAGRTYRYFEVYVSLAIIYWIITIIVEQGIKLIEKKIRIPENAPAIQTDEGALNQ